MDGGAERGDKDHSFNILSIADLGGATIYGSEDNFIGLARYLKKQNRENKIKMLFIGGGALPFFPQRGSNRSNDYLDVIEDHLQFLRDASAAMKPHLERILLSLPEDATVIYTLGDQDRRNIDELIREIGLDFKIIKGGIENRMHEAISFIVGRKGIISTTETSISVLREELKNKQLSESEHASKLFELRNAITKLRINKEELKEWKYKLDLINQLYSMKLTTSNEEAINELFQKKMEELKQIRNELKKIKLEGGDYEEVASRAKKVSNEIRMLSNRLSDIKEAEKVRKSSQANMRIDLFSHNSITLKKSHDIITELAKAYYLSELKNAFGRKRKIHIQMDMLEVHEVHSKSLSFNVVTAYDLNVAHLSTRKKSSNDHVSDVFNKLYVNGVLGGKQLEAKPINVILTAKKDFTSFSIDPLFNNSNSALVSLSQGPFWNVKAGVAKAWNSGIDTKETQSVQKGYLSSGASLLSLSKEGPRWSIISSEYLSYLRGLDDKEEYRKFVKTYGSVDEEKGKGDEKAQSSNASVEHRQELDRTVLLHKRLSEMKLKDLPEGKEMLKQILPYYDLDLKSKYDLSKLSIAAFTDAHVGSHSKLKILEEAVDDAFKRKPDILVLLGDMIEGFLNDYAQVMRFGMEYDFPQKYEKELSSMGIPKEKRMQLVAEKMKEKFLDIRYNADEQPTIVAEKFGKLVYDVISREGLVYIIAGNHDNNSGNFGSQWHRDEAVSLSGHMKMFLEGALSQLERDREWLQSKYNESSEPAIKDAYAKLLKENSARIKVFEKGKQRIIPISGSEYGADEREINGIPILLSHKMGGASESSMLNFVEKKQTKAVLGLAGHDHILVAVYAGDKLLLKVQSNQDSRDNPYTKRIAAPVGDFINGYSMIDLEVNKKTNSIFKFSLLPKLGESLLRSKESIEEQRIDEKVRKNMLTAKV
ncbi:MAG: hypothetical protein ACP5SJ_01955 [Candidatus Micrarchaeia archaeon]